MNVHIFEKKFLRYISFGTMLFIWFGGTFVSDKHLLSLIAVAFLAAFLSKD